jgi:beta-galactosidase
MRAIVLALAAAALLATPAAAATPDSAPFPKGFLWGVATSGFQTEAGRGRDADRRADWWAWTHDVANIAAGHVTPDRVEDGPGSWRKWPTDVRLARRTLHASAFRLSVEWSRIFPRSTGRAHTLRALDRLADDRAVAHYRAVLRGIRRAGMEPFVTLQHFTLPRWLHEPEPGVVRGGWAAPRSVGEFRKYARYLAWKLGDLVTYWTPINEPMVMATFGYVNVPGAFAGWFPPGAFDFGAAIAVVRRLEAANAAAYDALRKGDRGSRVGLVQNMVAFTPADPSSAADVAATRNADYLFNKLFLAAAVRGDIDADADGVLVPGERHRHGRKADFIGVNYYFRSRVSALGGPLTPSIPVLDFLPASDYRSALHPERAPCPTTCSDFGNELYPDGLSQVLALAGGYGLPLYVTETGIADADDNQRPAFIVQHLARVRRAIAAGLPVRGVFHWSLVDNFEWAAGYSPRFGLFAYDRRTLRRTARPSAALYGRIARSNRIPEQDVQKFG